MTDIRNIPAQPHFGILIEESVELHGWVAYEAFTIREAWEQRCAELFGQRIYFRAIEAKPAAVSFNLTVHT